MDVIHTDCLVIGAGLAGSVYALHAARAGLDVQVLSLGAPTEANSDWAQGGIIFDTSANQESLADYIMTALADYGQDRAAGSDQQGSRLLDGAAGADGGNGIHNIGYGPVALPGGDPADTDPFGRLARQHIGIAYQQGYQFAHIGPDGFITVLFGRG